MAIVGEDKIPQEEAGLEQVDDRSEPLNAPETRERVEEAREQPKEKEGPAYDHKATDARQAIADKLKAQREFADKNPGINIPDEMERLLAGKNVKTRADRVREPEPVVPAPTAETIKTAEDIPAPVKRQIKVNGRDIEVDEDQLVNFAQIGAASETILEEAKLERAKAKQRLEEIERLQADHSRTRENPSETQQSKTAEDTKPATNDELDSIIEQIQFGDKGEAAKALRTYGDQLVERARENAAGTEDKVAHLVAQTLDNERVRGETQKALDSFMSENTDFASNPKRQGVLVDETLSVMEQNLLSYGVEKETLDKYAETNGLPPSVAVSTAYRRLRAEGHQLPDQSAVLKTAAANVRRDFGMPEPSRQQHPVKQVPDNSNFVAERQERKQAIVQQPRRANIAPAEQPTFTETSLDDKRRIAVQKMRQMRRGR
jgi:hypothetical protein